MRQNVPGFLLKMRNYYYKMLQLLQITMILLQNGTLLQIATVQ